MKSRRIRVRKWLVLLGISLCVLIAIQFMGPSVPQSPVAATLELPQEVAQVLRKGCYDCHSNETKLKWFDKVAPISWMVASHIKKGRSALNFSEWSKLSAGERKANLFLSLNKILAGDMPLKNYLRVHTDAEITPSDLMILKNYLISISPRIPEDSVAVRHAEQQFESWTGGQPEVKAAPNGINFLSSYKEWTPVSSTDRFDNGTMRVILGNPVAISAIREGNINPWPDGAVLAKVAWKQLLDTAGQIRPGEFLQVEFMIKDQHQYKETEGWGWARWKGMELVPYGSNALFTTECISCHQPMKNNDFVFTMPLHIKPGKL